RSSMKPLQASVSLSFCLYQFTDAEVSVMCASHNAEPIHVRTVRSLLARAGVEESALQTPSVRPWDGETLAADPTCRPINSDCSGKHGGMLSACRAQEWPLESYRDPRHPLQRAVEDSVLVASGAVRGGAEGLMCAALVSRGVGIAVKIRDGGAGRASGPALIRALAAFGVLSPEQLDRLAPFARPPVLGGGRPVGEIVADFGLDRAV